MMASSAGTKFQSVIPQVAASPLLEIGLDRWFHFSISISEPIRQERDFEQPDASESKRRPHFFSRDRGTSTHLKSLVLHLGHRRHPNAIVRVHGMRYPLF